MGFAVGAAGVTANAGEVEGGDGSPPPSPEVTYLPATATVRNLVTQGPEYWTTFEYVLRI